MEEAWTILKVLRWTTDYFKRKGIPQPRSDAEVLLAHALGLERLQLYLRHDQPLAGSELARFRDLVRRRAAREPAQYITGRQEFWSLELEVTPATLIPRPETEVLVEKALELIEGRPLRILDLGTGSGAIALALAHEAPQISVFATDRSTEALLVARRNARRHGLESRISFACMDLIEAFRPNGRLFHLVVSNPPYIGDVEIPALPPEVGFFEPRDALRGGGPLGIDLLVRILHQVPPFLQGSGHLLMEIGQGQEDPLARLVSGKTGVANFELIKDYSGMVRVLHVQMSER
ncbi:MAG: peptide chain release factor N(5)-glutamine methyltransferase [Syntrophobacteraceae bacterium]|jgi:release factor glutamine methyltransferase|nr:peptide chain release factor N(5)-glutamine methyltransferase [Syntrophobacteraceae bacterium]